MLNPITFYLSLKRLKHLEQNPDLTPYSRMNDYTGFGEFKRINAKQVPEEIELLGNLVKKQKPKTIMEIGTYRGGTLYLWCKLAPADAHILACDLPNNSLDNTFSPNRRKFYEHFAQPNQKLELIAADSHSTKTKNIIATKLRGKTIDFLFIDGDHSYKGVKADFELYFPLVSKGGTVAFHDILQRKSMPHIEVYTLWNHLKKKYKYKEFIAKKSTFARLVGIGVIWK